MFSRPIKNSGGGGAGIYAWRRFKITQEGKAFDKYVVNNNLERYPLGGEKNGKLYMIADKKFEDFTWPQISDIAHSGYADQLLSLGNMKDVTLTTGEVITIEVAGFNHDTYASGGTAPVSFVMKDCLKTTKPMNTTNTNVSGWDGSAMYTYCNVDLFNTLPADLKGLIKPIYKKTSSGNQSSTLKTTADKIWLLSMEEVFGTTNNYSASGEGTLYPIFTDNASRVKKVNGSANWWWLRSPCISDSSYFCSVGNGGSYGSYYASGARGVAAGFCI